VLHKFEVSFLEAILDMLIDLDHQTGYLCLSRLKINCFVEVEVKDKDQLAQLLNDFLILAV
jgi:hypothetical protein